MIAIILLLLGKFGAAHQPCIPQQPVYIICKHGACPSPPPKAGRCK